MTHRSQIMRYKKVGQLPFTLKTIQEIHDLGLTHGGGDLGRGGIDAGDISDDFDGLGCGRDRESDGRQQELTRGEKLIRTLPADAASAAIPAAGEKVAGTAVPRAGGRDFVTGAHRKRTFHFPSLFRGGIFRPMESTLPEGAEGLLQTYTEHGGINYLDAVATLPSRSAIDAACEELMSLMFPGFRGEALIDSSDLPEITSMTRPSTSVE